MAVKVTKCHNVCEQYRYKKNYHSSPPYINGAKYCSHCEKFLSNVLEQIHCPCCNEKMRTVPVCKSYRNRKDNTKHRILKPAYYRRY